MNLDLSAEYLCWDGTEAVVYEQTTKADARRFTVPIVKGRNIRGRERSPSGGVYAGYERNFHVPQRLLPDSFDGCKPGDVVVDAGETRWTVLTAEWDRLKQRWQLGTVNLVLANDLQDVLVIERASLSYDDAGAAVKRFNVTLYTLAARVQSLTKEIADERGERYDKGRWEAIVSSQIPLVDIAEDRARWIDPTGAVVYFDLTGVRNSERIDELPVIEMEERR